MGVAFALWSGLFEVEPGKVHVAAGEDVDGEDAFAGGEVEFEEAWG